MTRRLRKVFAMLALAGMLGMAALFGFLWLEHRSAVTLPTPTGSFTVGRTILDWTDPATLDNLAPAPAPGATRELLVWIWYPSAAGPSAAKDDYLPVSLRYHGRNNPNIWTLLTRDPANVRGHSVRNPAVSPQQPSYPVVIFRGGGSSGALNYSALAEDLASHGYVVVGFDAPWRTSLVVFPDGRTMARTAQNNPESCVVPDRARMEQCVNRVMSAWTGDIGFVLDRLAALNAADPSGILTRRLDLARVGIFGHSLGGAVAAQFCSEDSRCSAGIDIDGAPHGSVIEAGLHQPFMFLLSDHRHETDSGSAQIRRDIQSIQDRQPPDHRLQATIRGAFHYTFSDDGALLKSRVVRALIRLTGRLGMSGRRQLAVTSYCLHSFFDAYLKGTGGSRPAIPSPRYPEIQVLE